MARYFWILEIREANAYTFLLHNTVAACVLPRRQTPIPTYLIPRHRETYLPLQAAIASFTICECAYIYRKTKTATTAIDQLSIDVKTCIGKQDGMRVSIREGRVLPGGRRRRRLAPLDPFADSIEKYYARSRVCRIRNKRRYNARMKTWRK